MKHDQASEIDTERRSFLEKMAYVAPAIVTLSALPSFASAGSGYQSQIDKWQKEYPQVDNEFWEQLEQWIAKWKWW